MVGSGLRGDKTFVSIVDFNDFNPNKRSGQSPHQKDSGRRRRWDKRSDIYDRLHYVASTEWLFPYA